MLFSKKHMVKVGSFAILAWSLGGCGYYSANYTGTESTPGFSGGTSSGSYQVSMTLFDQGGGKVRGTYGSNSPLFQAGTIEANANGDTLSNFTISMYSNATSGSSTCQFVGNVTSNGVTRDTLQGSLIGSGTNCSGQTKILQLNRVK